VVAISSTPTFSTRWEILGNPHQADLEVVDTWLAQRWREFHLLLSTEHIS
jgi:hypothetical protein